MHTTRILRRGACLFAGGAMLAALSCSDFLVAENPAAVEEQDVNDPIYIGLIANMPVFAFQDAQDDVMYWNAQLVDEIFNREVFIEEGQIDRRELYSDMTYITAFMYNPMQRARFSGEDATRRLSAILGDTASRDTRVARALAYAGYSYVYLGEMSCSVPIDLGAPKDPDEIFEDAIAKFDSAVTIATAARTYLQSLPVPDANAIAATDSVRNFALVGAARAAWNRNEGARATTYATQVAAAFEFRAYYSINTAAQNHRLFNRIGETRFSGTMTNTPYLAMTTDPRIPRLTTGTQAGKPLSPASYSTFNGQAGGAGGALAATMSVRIASQLEAQYIIHEANPTTAAASAFVDARRAAGAQTALNLPAGDPQVLVELREQRRRDFYLTNHRLGDLRRYKRHFGIDLFPTGAYPGSTSGQVYNVAVDCWPLPTSEINGNPNIPK